MVNMENYEEYMLLYADGELKGAEEKALLDFVAQHPQLKAELEMYAATKLQPDETVVYEQKEQLLKKEPARRTIALDRKWMYMAAAACIAMMLVMILKNNGDNGQETTIVKNNNKATAPVIYTEPQPVDTKTVHSTPVNPIPENTIQPQQQAIAKATKRSAPTIKQQTIPQEPVLVKKQESAPLPKVVEQPKPEVVKQPQPVTPAPETIAKTEEEPVNVEPAPEKVKEKKEHRLLAMLAQDKLGGVNEIGRAMNRKIEKVKNATEKVKDADIAFKIGNRELFTVKL